MLKGISWGQYIIAVVILLGVYYLYVLIRYYKKDINGSFPHRQGTQKYEDGVTEDEDDQQSFDELQAVVDDLYAILEKAGREAGKNELLEQLQKRLANYTGLRKPPIRVAINHYIMRHAEDICGAVFSEGELDAAWKTLP